MTKWLDEDDKNLYVYYDAVGNMVIRSANTGMSITLNGVEAQNLLEFMQYGEQKPNEEP